MRDEPLDSKESVVTFSSSDLLPSLDDATDDALETLPFGIVRMDRDYRVTLYNRYESELSGLSASSVLGCHFFVEVAPCTNNFLVAHRYESEGALDESLDYVFTYKLSPTPVRLRLLRGAGADHAYLLVQLV